MTCTTKAVVPCLDGWYTCRPTAKRVADWYRSLPGTTGAWIVENTWGTFGVAYSTTEPVVAWHAIDDHWPNVAMVPADDDVHADPGSPRPRGPAQ